MGDNPMGINPGVFAGLFQGLSQGLEDREKKRSVSEDLFIELSKSSSMQLKPGAVYKPGMTRIQVLDLFEEMPEEEKSRLASSKLAPQALIDYFANNGVTELKDVKAGELTMGDLNEFRRMKGMTMSAEQAEATLGFREKKLSAEMQKNRADRLEKLVKFAAEYPAEFKQNRDALNMMLDIEEGSPEAVRIVEEKSNLPLLDKLGWFSKTKFKVTGKIDEQPKEQKKPLLSPPATNKATKAAPDLTQEEIDLFLANHPNDYETRMSEQKDEESLKKYIREDNAQRSQLSTPGATESPAIMQGLQGALTQPEKSVLPGMSPLEGAPVGPQGALPKTQPAPIAKGPGQTALTGGMDPNTKILEMARRYKQALKMRQMGKFEWSDADVAAV